MANDCRACRLPFTGDYLLGCHRCRFFLHIPCFLMSPLLVGHSAHPLHSLHLRCQPDDSSSRFHCNICGMWEDSGFNYHCNQCNFNAHALCAAMPQVEFGSAHQHPLSLNYNTSLQNKAFCHVCRRTICGSFYHCRDCQYEAHPRCLIIQQEKKLTERGNWTEWKLVMKVVTKCGTIAARKCFMHLLFDTFFGTGEAIDVLLFGSSDLQDIGHVFQAFQALQALCKDKQYLSLKVVSLNDESVPFRGKIEDESATLIQQHMKRMVESAVTSSFCNPRSSIMDNGSLQWQQSQKKLPSSIFDKGSTSGILDDGSLQLQSQISSESPMADPEKTFEYLLNMTAVSSVFVCDP